MAIRKSTHLLMLLISVLTYAAPAPDNKETGQKKNNLPTDDLKAASSSYSHQYSDWGGRSPGGYGFSVTGLGIVDEYTNKPGYKSFGGYDNSLKSTGNSALNGIGYEGAGYNGYFGSNNLSPGAVAGYGTNGYAANGYGTSEFGANGYGNSGFGANDYGSRGYSANAYGSSGFGANGYGNSGYSANAYGSSGFGANGYGTSGFAASGYGGNEYSSGYDNTGYISNNLGFGQKGFDRNLGNGGYGGFGGNGGLNSYYGYNNPNYVGGGHLGYGYYKGNIYNNGVTPNLVTGYRGYTRR